jgi:hypothetical protein
MRLDNLADRWCVWSGLMRCAIHQHPKAVIAPLREMHLIYLKFFAVYIRFIQKDSFEMNI